MLEIILHPFFLFFIVFLFLLFGYPVAFSLAGSAVFMALLSLWLGEFDLAFFSAIPQRIFGLMMNESLIAVPLFIFMGCLLEKSKISEELLESMSYLFGSINGGMAISVFIIGAIMAAATGIVGATVTMMGLICLPIMLKNKYSSSLSSGVVVSSGTLGQIIPPSIVLIILADIISNANQSAQLSLNNFNPTTVSVGDLFMGALFPGLLLVILYILYIVLLGVLKPNLVPASKNKINKKMLINAIKNIIFPILMIFFVLGSILLGIATPTEAGSIGCVATIIFIIIKRLFNISLLKETILQSTHTTTKIFAIFIGAAFFSLVFQGLEGDELIIEYLTSIEGSVTVIFIVVMLVLFFIGFFLDFIEISVVIIPIIAPVLIMMGLDPIWLGVMFAVNLQTSFLTPPFGFSLFYLRGVAPSSITTMQIYKGIIPFVIIQILCLLVLFLFPEIITWLPQQVYGNR